MCCFSAPVQYISDTNLFARRTDHGTQFLVYEMVYGSDRDVAMILPLPVSCYAEDAVKFIALDRYPHFFQNMAMAFPPAPDYVDDIQCALGGTEDLRSPLQVHEVGAFEASFVPTLDDFDRLDDRFKLPRQAWEKLPQYADYGFAVFKLRSTFAGRLWRRLRNNTRKVHPMALEFPTRLPEGLFFPTVHIHDGRVYPTADFDHSLYFQIDAEREDFWQESPHNIEERVDLNRARGIVKTGTCFRFEIHGEFLNEDTIIPDPGEMSFRTAA